MGLERGEGTTQRNGFLGRRSPQYEQNSTKYGEESYLTTIQVVMPPPKKKKYRLRLCVDTGRSSETAKAHRG
eukprot:TRINITY_DN6959_c0_g1_i1.p1 TRINITY_DN6959_c0_g1~~TRINITY_DN6959_c0_g1_i1.p1  ORF type:complete len:72 (-),score=27.64 TRINITY_DN6959_c0_g1_i1:2-217(-)